MRTSTMTSIGTSMATYDNFSASLRPTVGGRWSQAEASTILEAWGEHKAARRVHFKSLTDNIDTSTPSGRFFFHVMASLAQLERELIIERTRAGLKAARERGSRPGRRRRLDESKLISAKRLLASGIPARQVADNLGISVPTLYRWIPAAESLREPGLSAAS